ncbi:unnamed protein product [Durusdinium trenchii]|uniref:Uncharacterized protein n=1 Tax=Durusdinium trenchii TaxID=1381693 RepID=A0ABP0T1I1_9DINO
MALHMAAMEGHRDVLQLLVEANAAVDAGNYHGWTALIFAASKGHDGAVQLLLGAKADAANENGATALSLAAGNGHDGAVQLLLGAKADVAAAYENGDTALHRAAFYGQVQCVVPLVAAGASLDAKNKKGQTPLMLALKMKKIDAAAALKRAAGPCSSQQIAAGSSTHRALPPAERQKEAAPTSGAEPPAERATPSAVKAAGASQGYSAPAKASPTPPSPSSPAEDADKDQREKEGLDEADASKTKDEFPYDKLAEDALFLISGTTSLDAGTLRRINQEKKKIGEPELSTGTNAQELLNELEEEGFGVFGCGVGEEGAPLYRRIEANVGLLKYNPSKPLINDQDLRLKRGLGKDRWLIQYKHYSEKTKYGVLILAGTVDFFRLWAASEACRREVEDVPDGRLFAYIDSCIIRVNSPKFAKLWASNVAGPGYIVHSSGEIYSGSLKNSRQHGPGKQFYQNGDIFDGYFQAGQMHGNNCKYSYETGDRLEGTWADGQAVLAECKYVFQDGKQFEGKWPEAHMDAKRVQEYVSSCS